MAKGMYIGVGGVARKCKKTYIGIGGVARKIKKMYFGVGGKARLCFNSSNPPVKIASPQSLDVGRYLLTGGSIGNYALFVGGSTSSGISISANSYDVNLVKGALNGLYANRPAVANTGNHVLFGGGSQTAPLSSVKAYDGSLISKSASLSVARSRIASTSLQGRALFGNGRNADNLAISNSDAFDNDLTRTIFSTFYADDSGAVSIGNRAIFTGGYERTISAVTSTAISVSSDLISTPISPISVARRNPSGAVVGRFALFAGGKPNSDPVSNVDVYDDMLVKKSSTSLSKATSAHPIGIGVEGYAIFGLGNTVDVFDEDLVRTTIEPLTDNHDWYGTVTHVGKNILYAGSSSYSPLVEAYKLD